MKALLAFIILLIGLFVFTYFWVNHTYFNGHGPTTFFKSKLRKNSLVVFSVLCAIYSAYLFETADWGYGWVFVIIAFYILGYFFVTEGIRQNEMIDKVFRTYHAFSLPDIAIKKEDLLPNTAGFSMEWSGYSKPAVEKAMIYIKDEIKDGRIKNIFDIPSAIATYFAAMQNSKDPKTFEKVIFRKERLQKIHDRVYKGIDDRSKIRKIFRNVVTFIDRGFNNFSLISYQRPIFSQEQVELREHAMYKKGKNKKPEYKIMAMFTEIPGNLAYKFGWVDSLEDYILLANLEFARRNPDHYLSKKMKKKYKFSDQEIIDMADGGPIPKGLKYDL